MFEIGKLAKLMLGYVGEADSRTITIDMSAWLAKYDGATIVVQALRADKYPYFPATELADGVLTWKIAAEEVAIQGKGWAQIAAINLKTGQTYQSRVVETVVYESLDAFNTAEAGDPAQRWVNKVLQAAQEIKNLLSIGEEDSGKLIYINDEGKLTPLALGAGLQIVDGVLNVIGGTGGDSGEEDTTVQLYTVNGELFYTSDGAIFSVMGG